MDHYGIGTALRGAANILFQSARRTGRTTSLVESVKDGDRIIFANALEAERVRRLCLERGVKVECIVVPPSNPVEVFDRPTAEGRSIFDHTWVEQFYLDGLARLESDINTFERETSGYGAAHRETKRQFEEAAKRAPFLCTTCG